MNPTNLFDKVRIPSLENYTPSLPLLLKMIAITLKDDCRLLPMTSETAASEG